MGIPFTSVLIATLCVLQGAHQDLLSTAGRAVAWVSIASSRCLYASCRVRFKLYSALLDMLLQADVDELELGMVSSGAAAGVDISLSFVFVGMLPLLGGRAWHGALEQLQGDFSGSCWCLLGGKREVVLCCWTCC